MPISACASRNTATDWKRSAGALASALRMTLARPGSTPGGGCGGSARCRIITWPCVGPLNGNVPENSSYIMTPSE